MDRGTVGQEKIAGLTAEFLLPKFVGKKYAGILNEPLCLGTAGSKLTQQRTGFPAQYGEAA